jgi:hypothetical protein
MYVIAFSLLWPNTWGRQIKGRGFILLTVSEVSVFHGGEGLVAKNQRENAYASWLSHSLPPFYSVWAPSL